MISALSLLLTFICIIWWIIGVYFLLSWQHIIVTVWYIYCIVLYVLHPVGVKLCLKIKIKTPVKIDLRCFIKSTLFLIFGMRGLLYCLLNRFYTLFVLIRHFKNERDLFFIVGRSIIFLIAMTLVAWSHTVI